MAPFTVIGIGEVLWDVLPSGKQLGGAPLNFAFHALQSGAESHVISAVGHDALGDEILTQAAALGIGCHALQRNPHPTGTVEVQLDTQGVPTYNIREGVAWDYIEADTTACELMRHADAVCWGSLAQRSAASHKAIATLVALAPTAALRVFDINLRQHYYSFDVVRHSLDAANVLKLNDDELPVVATFEHLSGTPEEQLRTLAKRYALRYVVYTMGATGSLIIDNSGNKSYLATPKVEVVDTVGAGDSFTATFVARILAGATLCEAHEKAVRVAAEVCRHKGATPRLDVRNL